MDFQKLAYDLALIHAQESYRKYLQGFNDPFSMDAPQFLDSTNILYKHFEDAYCEYINSTEDYYKEIIETEAALLPIEF